MLCDGALIARYALDTAWLSDHVAQAAAFIHTSLQQGEFIHIGVSIVDDERMAALHRDHCRLDSTTDVLTFPLSEPGTPLEVDLAVCADEAARRAEELGHSIERELLLYIVHGLLHCCGYNDHTEADFAAMHETEDAVLEAIGVGATFVKRESARMSQRRHGEGLE
jgi:probable rRNA maturation factor